MKKKISLLVLLVMAVLAMCFGMVACSDTEHEHNLVKVEAHDSTCTAEGNIEYYRCKDKSCGKLYSDAAGKNQITLADTVVKMLDHQGGTATCSQKAECEVCGNEYGDFADHEWRAEWNKTAQGHNHFCKYCDAASTVMSHNHVVIDNDGKDATCTEPGKDPGDKCSICGYIHTEPGVIPAKGHEAKEHRTVSAATCTDDGYKIEHWYCADCDKYFSDEECENEVSATDVVQTKLGHDYGAWTTNGDGTHTRVCGNNAAHTETDNCSGGTATCQDKAVCDNCHSEYGELGEHNNAGELEYDDETGHYTTCGVCGERTSESAAQHEPEFEYDDDKHWTECECGYKTAEAEHAPKSITALVKTEVAATLYEGQILTADDIIVTATCECGHSYTLTAGYTVESKALIKGNNELEVVVSGTEVKTVVYADASDAPLRTLTLIGAKFVSGENTLSVKAGGKLTGVVLTAGKTFYGFKDAEQNYYTTDSFVMPDDDITITALYKEDMLHYAPSDHHNNWKASTNTAEHKEFGGVMGTEITFKPDSPNPVFFANSSSDSKTTDVNVYAPVYGKTFMMLTVINDNDDEYEITYGAENNGKYGQVLELTLAPHSTTVVPINYWLTDMSFVGCDHQITMISEISEEVKLGFYGYIAVDGRMAVSGLTVGGIDTWYSDGDTFDLSNMKVQAAIGVNKYSVNVYDYTVSVADGAAWNSSITEITVTAFGYEKVIKLNDLTEWLGFTFSRYMSDKSWITQQHKSVIGIDGTLQTASKLTINAGATSGKSSNFTTSGDNNDTKTQNYNVRVPVYGTRNAMLVVSNTGSTPLSFWMGSDVNSRGGVDITVQPGETNKLFMFTFSDNTPGGWMQIKLTADAPEGGEIEVYGYFMTNDGEIASMSVRNESQHKTSYQVGETLDTSNLVIKPTPSNTNQANDGNYTLNITNYKTEIVGHEGNEFTAEDSGKTFTVKVYWNNLETEYTVTVA